LSCERDIIISYNLLLISLEIIISFIEKDISKQKILIECGIINIIFPLFIYLSLPLSTSSTSKVKICIVKFIEILCKFENNGNDLVFKWKIIDFMKPILTLLFEDMKKILIKNKSQIIKEEKDNIEMKFFMKKSLEIINIVFIFLK
jgi:hypothetical protein